MPVFDQEKVDRLKKILKGHPRGITISDLSTTMEMNRNLVAKYLDILLISGQVDMQIIGAAKVYFLTHRVPISSMLEYSTEMLIILDQERNIIHVNKPLLEQVNETREALIGRKIKDLNHPFLKALPVRLTSRDTEQTMEQLSEIEYTINGNKRYYKVKRVQTAFEDGSKGITLIIEDITEDKTHREMLEFNEAQYRGIVEDQTEFITRFLPGGTVVFVNDAYARYLNKKKSELLGGPLIPNIDNDYIGIMNTCIESLDFQIPVKSFECQIHHSPGHNRWNVWTVRALFDDHQKLIEYQAVGKDNTEKREAATRINQYVKDLEFLSRKAQEFVEISADADIFQAIAQGLFEIIPDSLITVNSIDLTSDTLTVSAVLPVRDQEVLVKYLGNNLRGFTFNLGVLAEKQKKGFLRTILAGKIVVVEENLYDIFFRQIPQGTCDKIKEELNLGDNVYTIGLVRHGNIFGSVTFSPKKGNGAINASLIETFVRQASIVLHRRKTDNTLKESEKLYRSVIENIQDVFYRSDTSGTLLMASPSWARLLGYDSLDECIGYNIAEKFYFEPQRRKEFLTAVYRDGSVRDYEVTLKCRDGSPLYVSTTSHLYYNDSGFLLGVEGIFRDISELRAATKRTHDQIEQMNFFSRKLQDFVELAPESDIFLAIGAAVSEITPHAAISVCSFDHGSNTLMVRAIFSDRDHEMLNKILKKEIIGMIIPVNDIKLANMISGKIYTPQKIIFESIEPEIFTRIKNSLNIGEIYSVGLFWHDVRLGTITCALRKGEGITNIHLIEILARAASIALQRKLAEDAQKENEEIFSSVAQFAPFPIAIINPDGTYRYLNKKFIDIFGYDLHDFRTGKEWFSLAYPDPEYRKKAIDTWKADLETHKSGFERPERFIVRCKNGVDKEIVFHPVTLADKKQFVIYEEILQEQKSEDLQKLLSLIIESTSDAMIQENTDGIILSWNRGATNLFGNTKEEALGHNISLIIPQDHEEELNQIRNRVKHGETVFNQKLHLRHKDGAVIDIEATLSPVTNDNGIRTGLFTIARNTLPKNQKEQQKQVEEHDKISGENGVKEGDVNTGIAGLEITAMKNNGIIQPFHLSNALKMARDYIAILDRTGKCVWANDALVGAVHAETCADLEGKSIALYIAPEFRKIALDSLMEVKKSGNKTVQIMMLSSSGRVPVETNLSAITTEEGDLFGYLAIARNIERDKAEKPKR
jgi:PAS domain S-box-containing protein